jgi:hypothetical protein
MLPNMGVKLNFEEVEVRILRKPSEIAQNSEHPQHPLNLQLSQSHVPNNP